MTKTWPPDLPPEQAYLTIQSCGVGMMIMTGFLASGISPSEPLSALPPILIYVMMQAIFRLGIRQAKRPIRARALLFIA